MTTLRMLAASAALTLLAAASAAAQRDSIAPSRADTAGDSRLSCAAYGVTLRTWLGDSAASADTAARPARHPGAVPRDTVITLAITDRSWTRDHVDAGVALGAAGTAGAHAVPWHACAGASTHLGTVTARLRDVHGRIHLKVDPGALDSAGRPRSSTPPAGPPRR